MNEITIDRGNLELLRRTPDATYVACSKTGRLLSANDRFFDELDLSHQSSELDVMKLSAFGGLDSASWLDDVIKLEGKPHTVVVTVKGLGPGKLVMHTACALDGSMITGTFVDFSRYAEQLPFPVYALCLHSGDVFHLNKAFCDLFGIQRREHPDTGPEAFFSSDDCNDQAKNNWEKSVRDGNGAPVEQLLHMRDARRRVIVAFDQSCICNQEESIVLGSLADVTDLAKSKHRFQQLASCYQDIFNVDCLNLGVQLLEKTEDIFVVNWVNSRHDEILRTNNIPPFSYTDIATTSSAKANIALTNRLSDNLGARVGVERLGQGETVVETRYFALDELDGPRRELVAAIRDVQLPREFTELLCGFGAKNPFLLRDDISVAAFMKVERRYARSFNPSISEKTLRDGPKNDLVFVYGNDVFCDELIEQGKLLSKDDISTMLFSDRDLFNEEIEYQKVDRDVMKKECVDQRVEKHPELAHGFARVVKTPLYLNGAVVGVIAYYWDDTRTEEIMGNLRQVYQPWEILNGIPIPVCCKDELRRIVWCNDAFLTDIRPDVTLPEIVGLRDEDDNLHPPEVAEKYKNDEEYILENWGPGTTAVWREPHYRDNKRRIVEVRKTRTATGLQLLFSFVDDIHKNPDFVWIDWKNRKVRAGRDFVRRTDGTDPGFPEKTMSSLDRLLLAEGAVVSYSEFVGAPGSKTEKESRETASSAHNQKKRVTDWLKATSICDLFEIEVIDKRGYRLHRKEKPSYFSQQ